MELPVAVRTACHGCEILNMACRWTLRREIFQGFVHTRAAQNVASVRRTLKDNVALVKSLLCSDENGEGRMTLAASSTVDI